VDKGSDMPEPITGAIVAKAMGDSSPEMQKATANLLMRVLGPSADAIGEALGRYTSYRLRNVGRIVKRADLKSGNEDRGTANPRVAHKLLEEGSYCDDEIMVDYLGGVLAASRTPSGRDDRAVAWSSLVTSLSSLQLRAHFLLYREWAVRLHGLLDVNLGVNEGRNLAVMQIEMTEFCAALINQNDISIDAAIGHAIVGLVREGLLGDVYAFGPMAKMPPNMKVKTQYDDVLCVRPTVMGVELYGWAQGLPGLAPAEFVVKAEAFDAEDSIPRLSRIEFPELPALSSEA
jgi:hypothetical protein